MRQTGRPETKTYLISFCILLAIVLVSSCSRNGKMPGFIYGRLSHNPTTLDPAEIVDVTGGLIAARLFNGLIRLNRDLAVVPDIAESWDISKDGRVYTFHLRKDAAFSNNRAVTAHDFKYSFERVLDPKGRSPNTWVLDRIEGAREFMKGLSVGVAGIKAQDPQTLVITLERPFSPFLNLLCMTAAYVVPKEEVDRLGRDFSTHPVGSGPFVLKEWQHNNRLVLEKREVYFSDKTRVQGFVYRIIPEDLTAVAEFEVGNLDILSIPASEFSRFRSAEKWKDLVSSMEGINTYYLGFNCSRPPFSDPNARRAVSMAIDRKKILETFFEKRGRPASGPVPDLLRTWEKPALHDYDPVAAARLIKQTGLAGRTISLYVTSEQEVIDIAEIIQDYLSKAGLSVKIKQLEWSSYKAAVNEGEADMFWISWWADYPDAENFLFPLFHSSNHGAGGNRSRYTNSEVDALIEAGQRATGIKERDRAYGAAEEIIADEAPWVFFWHKNEYVVRQPHIRHFVIYPVYSMDKGTEISF